MTHLAQRAYQELPKPSITGATGPSRRYRKSNPSPYTVITCLINLHSLTRTDMTSVGLAALAEMAEVNQTLEVLRLA